MQQHQQQQLAKQLIAKGYNEIAVFNGEVSEVLNASLSFAVLAESSAESARLRPLALEVLRLFRPFVAAPDKALAQVIFYQACHAKLAAQELLSTASESDTRPHKLVSASMFARIHASANGISYNPAVTELFSETNQEKAFQRDVLAELDKLIQKLSDEHAPCDDEMEVVLECASLVLEVFRAENSHREQVKEFKPADEIVKVLSLVTPLSQEIIKVVSSEFSRSESLDLPKALQVLLKRLEEAKREIPDKRALTDWAKEGKFLTFLEMSEAGQDLMRRSLGRDVIPAEFNKILKSIARRWIVDVDNSSSRKQFIAPDELKEQPDLQAFLRDIRLTVPEFQQLEAARNVLTTRFAHQRTLEIAFDPFVWPRIAEAIFLTVPQALTLHTTEDVAPILKEQSIPRHYLTRARHYTPVCYALGGLEQILHKEAEALAGARYEDSCFLREQKDPIVINRQKSAPQVPTLATLLGLKNIEGPMFLLRTPHELDQRLPSAYGVFYQELTRDLPGYKRYNYGKMLTLYVSVQPEPKPRDEPSQELLGDLSVQELTHLGIVETADTSPPLEFIHAEISRQGFTGAAVEQERDSLEAAGTEDVSPKTESEPVVVLDQELPTDPPAQEPTNLGIVETVVVSAEPESKPADPLKEELPTVLPEQGSDALGVAETVVVSPKSKSKPAAKKTTQSQKPPREKIEDDQKIMAGLLKERVEAVIASPVWEKLVNPKIPYKDNAFLTVLSILARGERPSNSEKKAFLGYLNNRDNFASNRHLTTDLNAELDQFVRDI